MTSEFGVRRRFNRKVRSVHQGMDMRAETGTPVGAMNSGMVIVAREMFYEGGFVVIDHGQGLLTLYMHLSEISVKEGDNVRKASDHRIERRNRQSHRSTPACRSPVAGDLH